MTARAGVEADAAADLPRGDETILVLAPTGADAARACAALASAGFIARACQGVEEVCRAVAAETGGAALVAQEALTPPARAGLCAALAAQPPWSDLPLLVLTGKGHAADPAARALESLAGATFLERPLRAATLVRAVRAAVAARRRQYEIREYLRERQRAAEERVALLEAQRRFLRDVLSSVTAGKLRLCDDAADLPPRLPPVGEPVALDAASLRDLRRRALEAAGRLGFDAARRNDLATAVGEASMNAVRHAGGGTASVGADSASGAVQVWVEDRGRGIDVRHLPQATLEPGYSSAGTLGHGFWFMLNTADRLYLMTGPTGTTVVIEMERAAPQPAWFGAVGGGGSGAP